jgi:hypothetical protein
LPHWICRLLMLLRHSVLDAAAVSKMQSADCVIASSGF